VVEGARLERVYTGNRIEGSNPSPSASPPFSGPIKRDYKPFWALHVSFELLTALAAQARSVLSSPQMI
jgi:hypothetical protein